MKSSKSCRRYLLVYRKVHTRGKINNQTRQLKTREFMMGGLSSLDDYVVRFEIAMDKATR